MIFQIIRPFIIVPHYIRRKLRSLYECLDAMEVVKCVDGDVGAVARPSSSSSLGVEEEDGDELRRRIVAKIPPSKEDEGASPTSFSSNGDKIVDSSLSSPPGNRVPSSSSKTAPSVPGTTSSSWQAVPHHALPPWLQDNDYLVRGHRPELQSTVECLRSIFRLHTETLNIWTHLLGALLFVYFAVFYLLRGGSGESGSGSVEGGDALGDKMVFLVFFAAAITCMSLSWLFHTMCCHSSDVSLFCVKLDYCGIAILIVGSFVPWLYFGFYCSFFAKCLYVTVIVTLGATTVTVAMWDRFSLPHWRPLRAGLFAFLGLSGVIPATHFSLLEGVVAALTAGGLGWLLLMAAIFIFGALLYACRIPERFFPGKCDIVFQSHQIFHVCVVAGCYVEYYGICQLSEYMRSRGVCT